MPMFSINNRTGTLLQLQGIHGVTLKKIHFKGLSCFMGLQRVGCNAGEF